MSNDHVTQGWNWAHLGGLAILPLYATAALQGGWNGQAALAAHLVLTLVWFGVAERWLPHRADWAPDGRALRRDGIFFSVNALADTLGGWLAASLALLLAARPAAAGLAAALPLWAAAPLALLVSELAAYWLHRAMHTGGWLWRVHAVHHRPPSLNVANNLTTHPINVLLLKLVKVLPLMLLGFEANAVLLAALFQQLQSFATHANTQGRMGWLNYLVGTAELHRRHHSVDPREAQNFATALPVWDQVFGTFRFRGTREPAAVGVSDPQHYPASTDWRGLMRLPFRREV
ncbi:sterol desaturase family protein [Aquabacterium sp. A7-Y]|uniref:sterol desaturase family protein n=1 Tax=Aquabacterium sp. A7-Y TaxID=1349605 RepID=UPI00223D0D0E|nr:sterol desaturase family protein [Aquabacterium sp. A7-Y]MCW7540981.1 sterol desaturase family protein [Aquabacterium sp. A7-Y]